MWSQKLDLLPEQARKIEARLWSDIKEENRYYIYHHFDDNCTTRLRDMIDEATGGKLREGSGGAHPLTFRQFGASGLAAKHVLNIRPHQIRTMQSNAVASGIAQTPEHNRSFHPARLNRFD